MTYYDNALREARIQFESAQEQDVLEAIEASNEPIVHDRVEYEQYRLALRDLSKGINGKGEAVLRILWNVYKKKMFQKFAEYDTLKEWADVEIGSLWGDNKEWLWDLCRAAEGPLKWLHENPLVDPETGEITTADDLVEQNGVGSKLKAANQIFNPHAMKPENETEDGEEVQYIPVTDEDRASVMKTIASGESREKVRQQTQQIVGTQKKVLEYVEVYDAENDTYDIVFSDLNAFQKKLLLQTLGSHAKEVFI